MTEADVNTPSPNWYTPAEAHRALPRALMGGTAEMRQHPEYLPRNAGETEADYAVRLRLAVLLGFYSDAVRKLTGRAFREPIRLGDDVPLEIRGREGSDDEPPIEGWAENIDMCGHNLTAFAMEVFRWRVGEGFRVVLVDHQRPLAPPRRNLNGQVTEEEARRVSGRPYWVDIRAADLIDADVRYENGQEVVYSLRVRCPRVVREGYAERTVERVKVIRRPANGERFVSFQSHEKDANGKWQPSAAEGDSGFMEPMKEIPAVAFPGWLSIRPPLEALAYAEGEHWAKKADFDGYFHYAKVPKIYWAGGSEELLAKQHAVGGGYIFHGPVGTSMVSVEHNGTAIASAVADMERLERRMEILGLEPLMPERTQTLGEKMIDSAEAHSTLASWVAQFTDGLEQLLMFTAAYRGEASGGSVTMTPDYLPQRAEQAVLAAVGEARRDGDLTRRTRWKVMKEQGALPDDFDAAAEEEALDAEERERAKTPPVALTARPLSTFGTLEPIAPRSGGAEGKEA